MVKEVTVMKWKDVENMVEMCNHELNIICKYVCTLSISDIFQYEMVYHTEHGWSQMYYNILKYSKTEISSGNRRENHTLLHSSCHEL